MSQEVKRNSTMLDAFEDELRRAWGIDSALHGLIESTGGGLALSGVPTLQNDHIENLTQIKADLHELLHKAGKVATPSEGDDGEDD
jgi:hypothetical protein